MDIKKIIKNKYSNWEVTPRKRNDNADALNSAEKANISFSDVKKKYSIAKGNIGNADSSGEEIGIDKNWKSAFIAPKDKTVDDLMEEKIRFFDNKGNEVASQG